MYCTRCGISTEPGHKCLRDTKTRPTAPTSAEEWLAMGHARGWCGPPVCETHDGTPTTADEDTEFDDGGDPCIPIVRLYREPGDRTGVEANHSPGLWRAR